MALLAEPDGVTLVLRAGAVAKDREGRLAWRRRTHGTAGRCTISALDGA
jgi:hypothetical protein